MEKTNYSKDTSQKGREEEVVNQQEQNRTTNAGSDETNRGTQMTGSSSGNTAGQGREGTSGNNDSGQSRQGSERADSGQDRNNGNSGRENSYSQGQGNNDNDLGREDAEKTKRETPRM